jgi:hypothetical protein
MASARGATSSFGTSSSSSPGAGSFRKRVSSSSTSGGGGGGSGAGAGAGAGGGPVGTAKLRAWLEAAASQPGGLLDVLTDAIAPLSLDPEAQPGRLSSLEKVHGALQYANAYQKIAGQICFGASLAAEKLELTATASENWKFSLDRVTDAHTKKTIEDAMKTQAREAPPTSGFGVRQKLNVEPADPNAPLNLPGAKQIHSELGLPPSMWGLSKAQFALFLDEVRAAHKSGKISNYTRGDHPMGPYPQDKFDDPAIGPNIHQVNMWFIKPATKACMPLPGVSYALKLNLARGGLKCDLLISHAWDEGVYELGRRVLAAWPDDCEGAFISCLSAPAHIPEVGGMIMGHSSASVLATPFAMAARAEPPPVAHVVIAGGSTPVLSRLGCCMEVLVASSAGVRSVTVEGATTDLISGIEKGKSLKAAVDDDAAAGYDAGAAAMAAMEARVRGEDSNSIRKAERRHEEAKKRLEECAMRLAKARLDVLSAKASELLELELATCTSATDRAVIKEYLKRNGVDASCRQVCSLIRKSVCGIQVAGKDVRMIDGALGPLPLDQKVLKLTGQDAQLSLPTRVMHLATWLWSRPSVENLDLSACQPLQDEVPQIVCDVIAAGLVPTLSSVNVDGVALPVRLLNGSDKAEVVDMAGKRLGLASGLVIAALIGSNSSAKSLRLANNPLRDEGIAAIARAIQTNPNCKLELIDVASTRFAIEGGKELARMVGQMKSLTTLDLTNNRLCGVWVDQYGQQGTWSNVAMLAMAEAIRGSKSLSSLLIGGNKIRDEGVRAIVAALREDPELQVLHMPNNEIGTEGACELASAVGEMVSLADLDLSNNVICGAGSCGGRPPAKYTSAGVTAIIDAARRSRSLAKLNVSNNRLCGVWSDAYGNQQFGTYDPAGAEIIADLLRSRGASTLTHLDMSSNNIGTQGGKALYAALRQNEECPLTFLDLRHSRLDPATERFLRDISQARAQPLILEI